MTPSSMEESRLGLSALAQAPFHHRSPHDSQQHGGIKAWTVSSCPGSPSFTHNLYSGQGWDVNNLKQLLLLPVLHAGRVDEVQHLLPGVDARQARKVVFQISAALLDPL